MIRGGLVVEFLFITLCVCLLILSYFAYKFIIFRQNQKSILQIKQIRNEYKKARAKELQEVRNNQKKTNIFREMAIEEIAKQKLIYDEESGCYVRRRQIN
jgi:membrane protein insertase Oxa1/YidC/SpoIIIJ